MKIQLNEQHRRILGGAIVVIAAAIVLYFSFLRIAEVRLWIRQFLSILSPFIFGFVLAFLLRTPMDFIEHMLMKKWQLKDSRKHRLAVLFAMIFGIAIMIVFFYLLLPQLYRSIVQLADNVQLYMSNINELLLYVSETYQIDLTMLEKYLPSTTEATAWVLEFLPNVITATTNIVSLIVKLFIGVIICVYMLMDIQAFTKQTRRFFYAFFPEKTANRILYVCRLTDRIFVDFISGKILDSLIIGVLCYIGMSIFKMPYALLISVIIGCTNVIPFFGPFIGAVPGIFIVLVVSPTQAIWFALFILALQQFDGNILGPKILGDTIGLPAIWIMFAIIMASGLFGLVGMFIGVPAFSVVYFLIKEKMEENLEKKQLPLQ